MKAELVKCAACPGLTEAHNTYFGKPICGVCWEGLLFPEGRPA